MNELKTIATFATAGEVAMRTITVDHLLSDEYLSKWEGGGTNGWYPTTAAQEEQEWGDELLNDPDLSARVEAMRSAEAQGLRCVLVTKYDVVELRTFATDEDARHAMITFYTELAESQGYTLS